MLFACHPPTVSADGCTPESHTDKQQAERNKGQGKEEIAPRKGALLDDDTVGACNQGELVSAVDLKQATLRFGWPEHEGNVALLLNERLLGTEELTDHWMHFHRLFFLNLLVST